MLLTLLNYYIATVYSIFFKKKNIKPGSKRNKYETNMIRSKEFSYQRDGK